MNRSLPRWIACLFALALAAGTWAGQSVEIRTESGAKWRGEIGDTVELTYQTGNSKMDFTCQLLQVADRYIKVEGMVAGRMAKKVIFKTDIISIRTVKDAPAGAGSSPPPAGDRKPDASGKAGPGAKPVSAGDAEAATDDEGPGVFFLPWEGTVGTFIRDNELVELGKHADEYGPGQIIVLQISSNGGLVIEEHEIQKEIYKLRERHRVVAWVHKALSAGCFIAMCCEEIYFMTEGVCGSVTTISGSSAVQGEAQDRYVQVMVDMAVRQGYSEHIARSMKASRFMCTYDKDEETGEVTFYGDMSGEHVLSDDKSNLCFNASNALDCGFSDGTADTTDELAKLLQLPKWREIDDYGRKIAEEWKETCERAEEEIPLTLARLDYKGTGSGSSTVVIGTRIKLLKQLVRWWDRAPEVARMHLPPKEYLERQIEDLRRQLRR